MMEIKLKRFPISKIYNFGIINIDGDRFLLSIPTDEMWHNLMVVIKSDFHLMQLWQTYWNNAAASNVFIQAFSDKLFLTERRCDDLDVRDKLMDVSINFATSRRGFLPVLFPLTPGLDYDDHACNDDYQGIITSGGTFFVDGEAKRLSGHIEDFVDERMCYRNDNTVYLGVGNSVNNEDPAYVLPWIQIDGAYVCLRCVVTGYSLNELFDLFGAHNE